MDTFKNQQDCDKSLLAIRDTLDILSGKWKIPIIGALIYYKSVKFNELQRLVGNISPRMLSKELKDLEVHKIIKRKLLSDRPVSIVYEITPHGESCQSLLIELEKWGAKHREHILKKD